MQLQRLQASLPPGWLHLHRQLPGFPLEGAGVETGDSCKRASITISSSLPPRRFRVWASVTLYREDIKRDRAARFAGSGPILWLSERRSTHTGARSSRSSYSACRHTSTPSDRTDTCSSRACQPSVQAGWPEISPTQQALLPLLLVTAGGLRVTPVALYGRAVQWVKLYSVLLSTVPKCTAFLLCA